MATATQGSLVQHDRYGEGIIAKVNLTNYDIFFEKMGRMTIKSESHELQILDSPADAPAPIQIDAKMMKSMLTDFFDEYAPQPEMVELGDKWEGGTMILKPANSELQPKEVPIETFFHKIVMMRDKLRVLEQNINAHKVLSDEEKVNLQQYISRCYGSMTSFNVLFKHKADQFSSK